YENTLKMKLPKFARLTLPPCFRFVIQQLRQPFCKQYATDPLGNWIAKDVAIYLMTALAVRSITQAKGITEVNVLVPVVDFFGSQIVPELQSSNPPALILKADALKFVSTFRQQVWPTPPFLKQ